MIIKIEPLAGFCFGVVSAINLVEKELRDNEKLYCLGDIVHNNMEVERLSKLGLEVIDIERMKTLKDTKIMIRAHGEPPSTYALAKENNIEIIDATCPIVLKLQQNVRKGYLRMKEIGGQVVIYGKKGHAEVVGLVGQTNNEAIVVSSKEDLDLINFEKPIHLFSQTTMSKEDYKSLCDEVLLRYNSNNKTNNDLIITNSICGKVSSRSKELIEFSDTVDVLLFVSGKNSSNGMYLFNLCKEHKEKTYLISKKEDVKKEWFEDCESVGISGATSTPRWLMEEIMQECISIN
ncbi:MAG: 4-hydroxy-3-methylbut-2-enyl diphosphate reductase [Bacteroidales bacterium]|mgnify:CR=1 FL=1|jgi:4-hydroxy-3-methylbut-2-enyl diphosphate reductase|nr:4-hydroxy-3-methylbut-2-enyl diphosphate reductase [Bacteroidales bacterium]MDD4703481.1 4-hydroxy-3-methylbut-2-enyl diphosphate reductase [Bacteroidales bacterium]MDX9798375.1 4-hydroxy-3-methylbut-2-enyl diphosphate reductase [Bacteroidales bacterium]